MSFPLIYVNGCSYSDENYNSSLQNSTYAYHYGNIVNGYVFSRARTGSCNRRIIRTTAHDMIEHRRINPNQKIVALIQLTFEIRDELWIDEINQTLDPCESQFRTHQFSNMLDWKTRLLNQQPILAGSLKIQNVDSGFLKKWSEGRAFFYSSYAQRINLLLDVLLLTKLLDSLNVEYLIFQGPVAERLDDEHLKNFFHSELEKNSRVLNFETFGFCDWCDTRGFVPIDSKERRSAGHYNADAHQAFAEEFLIKIL